MAVDFPFGLPSEFVSQVGWEARWSHYVARLAAYCKEDYKTLLRTFKAMRPKGQKDLKRLIDNRVRSVSPLNITHPPVGLMFFEGAPRLLRSRASIIPMRPIPEADRWVVEGYPALVAEQWIKSRSYKDTRPTQRTRCKVQRTDLLQKLLSDEVGGYYRFRISVANSKLQISMIEDVKGDLLDAFLCATQGAWAWMKREARFGIPEDCGSNEGWITDPAVAIPLKLPAKL